MGKPLKGFSPIAPPEEKALDPKGTVAAVWIFVPQSKHPATVAGPLSVSIRSAM
jgi:hypothetical protein